MFVAASLRALVRRRKPPAPIRPSGRAAYHDRVLDHYRNPRNVGSFDANDPSVGTGLVGAPACGDVMKLQIRVEGSVIRDARFKTFGCGSAIASSSLATEWVKGRTIDEAMAIKNTAIAQYLVLPPVKLHCSMLAEDAIKAAFADYKRKCQALRGAEEDKVENEVNERTDNDAAPTEANSRAET